MLRIGVMLDSLLVVPAWVAGILERIGQSDSAKVCLVICRGGTAAENNKHRSKLVFELWQALDRRVFSNRPKRQDANQSVPLQLNADVPTFFQSKEQWNPLQLGAANKTGLDVILDFTNLQNLSTQMKQLPRFGWWSIGDIPAATIFDRMERAKPMQETGFDVYRADRTVHVRCSLFACFAMSLHQNRNHVCWRTADAVLRCLEGVDRSGWSFLNNLRTESPCSVYTQPGNSRMLSFLARLSMRIALETLRRILFREDWFIAYGPRTGLSRESPATVDFNVVRAPTKRFYADPFVITKDERTFVFFEDFSRENKKACISCIELRTDGSCSVPEPILETGYHLSYPCIFEWRREMYMIPESIANHRIELYRAHDFPRGWQLERVLIDQVSCVDPTILEHDGKFWLFASGTANTHSIYAKTDDELLLYFAETPLGPWTPHPMNPIVCDVRRCRPAGRFFQQDGALIRPSQDCSETYGRAVTLNRVQVLTETEYREAPVATIGPEWFPRNLGTHTYDRCQAWHVVDGRTWTGSRWTLRPHNRYVQHVTNKAELFFPRKAPQQPAA